MNDWTAEAEPSIPEATEERIEAIATGMLARYRTPKVAREMCYWHAMDHGPNTAGRVHWLRVYERIISLSPDIAF